MSPSHTINNITHTFYEIPDDTARLFNPTYIVYKRLSIVFEHDNLTGQKTFMFASTDMPTASYDTRIDDLVDDILSGHYDGGSSNVRKSLFEVNVPRIYNFIPREMFLSHITDPLNINVSDQCYVLIELDRSVEWRFSPHKPLVNTKGDYGDKNCNVVATMDRNEDGSDGEDCHMVHFGVVYRENYDYHKVEHQYFNFHVEMFSLDRGEHVKLIIDPDVTNPGGSGVPPHPPSFVRRESKHAKPARPARRSPTPAAAAAADSRLRQRPGGSPLPVVGLARSGAPGHPLWMALEAELEGAE